MHAQPPTLLVVDDERVLRQLIREMLEPEGYQVLTAAHGREALSILAVQSVDLIITDLRMPELDGVALCQELACLPGAQRTPVILLTAAADDVSAEVRATVPCLPKPFELDALLRLITQVLRDPRP